MAAIVLLVKKDNQGCCAAVLRANLRSSLLRWLRPPILASKTELKRTAVHAFATLMR